MNNIPNKERLAAIAYGSVRQSQDEGMFMARALLIALEQKPFGFVTKRCSEHMHDDDSSDSNWMWSISAVVMGVDPKLKHEVPVYLYPSRIPAAVPDESQSRELFEAWFASDCSFDCSPEATDVDNYAWKESLWYTWEK